MRIGDERVRKSTAQSLRVEYEQITFHDGESVEDFALCLSNIVQRLAIIGDPEPEPKVVAKYLRVAQPRYKQLIVSIETLLDIDTLSVEEVTGRLKAATSPAHNIAGKLRLMEEQWLERYKSGIRSPAVAGRAPAAAASVEAEAAGAALAAATSRRPGRTRASPSPTTLARPVVRKDTAHWPKTAEVRRSRSRPTWTRMMSPHYSWRWALCRRRGLIPKSSRRRHQSRSWRFRRRSATTASSTSSRTKSSPTSMSLATGI
jgi:hypothetical protein